MTEDNKKNSLPERILKFINSLQRPKVATKKTGGGIIYGDITNRLFAVAVDMIILFPVAYFVPQIFVKYFASDVDKIIFINVFQYILLGVYSVFFIHKSGATPGKMVLGLKVVDNTTGSEISWEQAIIRFLAYATAPLGLLAGGVRKNKRCWHDFIADTVVIYAPNRWYKRHTDTVKKFFNR